MLTLADVERAITDEALASVRRRFGIVAADPNATPERWKSVWAQLEASYVDAITAAREVFPK